MSHRIVYPLLALALALFVLLGCSAPAGSGLAQGCANATCAPARTPTMPTMR